MNQAQDTQMIVDSPNQSDPARCVYLPIITPALMICGHQHLLFSVEIRVKDNKHPSMIPTLAN